MKLTRREWPVLIFVLAYLPAFMFIAWQHSNIEFVLYALVVVVLGAWVLAKQPRVQFDGVILWGLAIWGLLHMAGGNIHVGDGVLYGVQLVPVVLRFDQLVHAFGFGVAALVCYHLLRPFLRDDIPRWRTLMVLVVLMGSGVGALNEIVEYIAVVTLPETGVGGYDNTLQDLIANLVGGVAAAGWLTIKRRRAAAVTPSA